MSLKYCWKPIFREFKEDTTTWEMCASTTPATRADVISLGVRLFVSFFKKLLESRKNYIKDYKKEEPEKLAFVLFDANCITSALVSQYTIFRLLISIDELIRQVTMNCLERGILLTHVRNELAMTLSSYQVLAIFFLFFQQNTRLCTKVALRLGYAKLWKQSKAKLT